MEITASCVLCGEFFFEKKDVVPFGIRGRKLRVLTEDWIGKAGTRHICKNCLSVVETCFIDDATRCELENILYLVGEDENE